MTNRSPRVPKPLATTHVKVGLRADSVNECAHPRCSAPPQDMYQFPIPLCRGHFVKVLARASEVALDAKRLFLVQNRGKRFAVNVKSAANAHAPVVYYIQFGNRVKIGTTTNLPSRLSALPHDRLLAVEPGDAAVERMRHQQFAAQRMTGEWFKASKDLMLHTHAVRDKHAELLA